MTVRTLVVDDSPTMRAMVAHTLAHDPDIEIVGAADGPAQAREMIKALEPDVVTLDVEMPGMNGLEFLDKIMRLRPMPVVMLSTLTATGAETTIRALEIGAVDCFPKPNGVAAWGAMREELADMIKAAAQSRPRQRRAPPSPARPQVEYRPRPGSLIAIGASTGGVDALIELLSGFPALCPPTLIVQHMPASFTTSFAARLDRLAKPNVAEAVSGARLMPGHVYLAPGGTLHLEVVGGQLPRCRLSQGEKISGHRPSVDRLFHSVAKTVGAAATGAILTGMGADGAQGLKAMRDAGSRTVGQDEASCVVYGMPAAARQIGAVTVEMPLQRIAEQLLAECRA